MAPILKELEAPAATTTASAPHAKPANDSSARPQPVALEIPVSVNGARTVDGSEKRVPFSESTQTVLVFPHGAVIRIATPLTSGQLVFLTNEKTKKEVVCQVVKSKATGAAGAYVELQFTEPSLGFWGLQIPQAPAATVASHPPASAATPKSVASVTPVPAKPPVVPKPVAPAAQSSPAVKPMAPPPAGPVAAAPSVPAQANPATVDPPSAPAAAAPLEIADPEPAKSVAPVNSTPMVFPAPDSHVVPAPPVPPLRDYSKQIDVLFTAPPSPTTTVPEPPPAPPVSLQPSTDELKEQAARLQAQLSSLLFSQAPSAAAAPVTAKPELPAAEVAKKILEISKEEAKPAVETEPNPALPARKPALAPLGADEEVKIPSWLAPLSQNADIPAVESESSSETSSLNQSASLSSEEAPDSETSRTQGAVLGGSLLGEATSGEVSSTGSKKGLFLGLAAAVALVAGCCWYYYQNSYASTKVVAAHNTSGPPTTSETTSSIPAAPAVSSPAVKNDARPSELVSQPAKNSVSNTVPSAAAPAPAPKTSSSAPKSSQLVEVTPKPSLGDVHLAAPVVNHSATSQQMGDALASIDTKTIPGNPDPLAAAASSRNAPAVPLPVGGEVKVAQLLKSVPPIYPPIARSERVSGKVQIDALIDTAGNVASVKVLSGPTILHRAAVDAVKQWKYKPATLDGEPTSMHLTVTLEFKAQ